jgi:hypothetical protein
MRLSPSTVRSVTSPLIAAAFAALLAAPASGGVAAQLTAYGVTANGTLFRFDPFAPAAATTIGNLGVVPEAIDFRPGTNQLYAIDVGATTTQLYKVDTTTAALTPIGAGFPSIVAGAGAYSLGSKVGFDFNPRTLQGDGSVRIRVTDANGSNLRLNSDTGLVANVDTDLHIGTNSPFVDASAYINSAASTLPSAGTTTLFDMDSRNNSLYIQNPPNNGDMTLVGSFGFEITVNSGIAFDIFSQVPGDDSIADELAFAALTRNATSGGAYLLYDVNLATGGITGGRLVGGGLDFTGGLAVIAAPEPATLATLVGGAMLMRRRRR